MVLQLVDNMQIGSDGRLHITYAAAVYFSVVFAHGEQFVGCCHDVNMPAQHDCRRFGGPGGGNKRTKAVVVAALNKHPALGQITLDKIERFICLDEIAGDTSICNELLE